MLNVARLNPGYGWAAPIYTMHEALRGYFPWCMVGGATSQLDLPSVRPLSGPGCGWLQLRVPNWATSVDYFDPTFCGSGFSTGRHLVIEDFTFFLYLLVYILTLTVTIVASGCCIYSCTYLQSAVVFTHVPLQAYSQSISYSYKSIYIINTH